MKKLFTPDLCWALCEPRGCIPQVCFHKIQNQLKLLHLPSMVSEERLEGTKSKTKDREAEEEEMAAEQGEDGMHALDKDTNQESDEEQAKKEPENKVGYDL